MHYTAYSSRPVLTPLELRARWRAEMLPALRGDALDVGAGTGQSLGYLTGATRLVCLEPHTAYVRVHEQRTADQPGACVLRPGGRRLLLEHIAAPRGTWTRRAQRLVAPFCRWFDHGRDPARNTEGVSCRTGI